MQDEKGLLPLAVTTSAGMSGVASRVSIMAEDEARSSSSAPNPQASLPNSNLANNVDIMKEKLETATLSLNQMMAQATASTHELNHALFEAARSNMSEAIAFLNELTSTTDPSAAVALQADYLSRQTQAFHQQMEQVQFALTNLYKASTNPLQAEIAKNFQRFRIC